LPTLQEDLTTLLLRVKVGDATTLQEDSTTLLLKVNACDLGTLETKLFKGYLDVQCCLAYLTLTCVSGNVNHKDKRTFAYFDQYWKKLSTFNNKLQQ
jgi:hypothetical protein